MNEFLNGKDRRRVDEALSNDIMTDELGFRATACAGLIVFASRKVHATLLGIFYHSLR